MLLGLVKVSKKYWRLSKDEGELIWATKEATEIIHQEEPGSNRDPTKGPSQGS
jgi:hypothetical protein